MFVLYTVHGWPISITFVKNNQGIMFSAERRNYNELLLFIFNNVPINGNKWKYLPLIF